MDKGLIQIAKDERNYSCRTCQNSGYLSNDYGESCEVKCYRMSQWKPPDSYKRYLEDKYRKSIETKDW